MKKEVTCHWTHDEILLAIRAALELPNDAVLVFEGAQIDASINLSLTANWTELYGPHVPVVEEVPDLLDEIYLLLAEAGRTPIDWLTTPLAPYDGKTPEALLEAGRGDELLEDLRASIKG